MVASATTKGQETKDRIVEAAMKLVNLHGIAGVSMQAIMEETGLEKGGLYRHFESKEEIVIASFQKYISLVSDRLRKSGEGITSPIKRIHASIRALGSIAFDPIVVGGCMIMNISVESDFSNPKMKQLAKYVFVRWINHIAKEISAGVDQGEIRKSANGKVIASVMVSSIEGAIMLSAVSGDTNHANKVMDHLHEYIDSMR